MKKLITLILLLVCLGSYSQETGITGVVTYFFNDYQGDKPDIGAKIYVLDSIKHTDFNYKLISDFLTAKTYISLSNFSLQSLERNEEYVKKYEKKKKYADLVQRKKEEIENDKKDLSNYNDKLVKLNAETNEKFNQLTNSAADVRRELIYKEPIITRTIGATGNYTITLNEGVYYVIIESKNRTGLNQVEIMGKIYATKVKIVSGQLKDISHNFSIY